MISIQVEVPSHSRLLLLATLTGPKTVRRPPYLPSTWIPEPTSRDPLPSRDPAVVGVPRKPMAAWQKSSVYSLSPQIYLPNFRFGT